jgi:hypothetical protein
MEVVCNCETKEDSEKVIQMQAKEVAEKLDRHD